MHGKASMGRSEKEKKISRRRQEVSQTKHLQQEKYKILLDQQALCTMLQMEEDFLENSETILTLSNTVTAVLNLLTSLRRSEISAQQIAPIRALMKHSVIQNSSTILRGISVSAMNKCVRSTLVEKQLKIRYNSRSLKTSKTGEKLLRHERSQQTALHILMQNDQHIA